MAKSGCPKGKVRNPKTGRCIKASSRKRKKNWYKQGRSVTVSVYNYDINGKRIPGSIGHQTLTLREIKVGLNNAQSKPEYAAYVDFMKQWEKKWGR